MSQDLFLGILASLGAAACYDTAYALMAYEARRSPSDKALRASLLGHLIRRPIWAGAVALNIAGWPLQLLALSLVPLTVVQPTLALGLLLLLALGSRLLDERVGAKEVAGALAIVAGVAGIAWAAPERTTQHAGAVALSAAFLILTLATLVPWALRFAGRRPLLVVLAASAGAADTWAALASKLIVDDLSGSRRLVALIWALSAGLAVFFGLTADMTALQRYEATRVGPIVLVMEVTIPVLLAPLLIGETWGGTPLGGGALLLSLAVVAGGAALLGSSRAIAGLLVGTSGGDRDP
jgi:drug/metabolite transporter (DMT)-like permease